MITPRKTIRTHDVAGHYDDLDALYRRVWGDHVHHGLWLTGDESVSVATENMVDRVGSLLGLKPGDRVCDIGCGYGATARRLVSAFGADVTGVTLSRAQFVHAQSVAPGASPRFVYGDFLANEFESASFDAAYAIESTEHFADKPGLFAEIHRVLRPGGRLVVCAWLAADAPKPWHVRRLLEPICREGRLPGLGSEADYRELLRGAGFRDVEFDDVTACVARTWPIIVRRMITRLPWDPAAWQSLLRRPRNAIFALTIPRIALAYRAGAMRYGILVATNGTE